MKYTTGQIIPLFVESVIPQDHVVLNTSLKFDGDQFELPHQEQLHKLSIGSEVLCALFDSKQNFSHFGSLMASMHLEKYANCDLSDLKPHQQVELYIIRETDLGFKCIVDGKYIGLLYKNEIFQPLNAHDQVLGFIKIIRDDNRIDLILRAPGHQATDDISDKILSLLKNNNGYLEITDKTEPEKIYQLFGASKKKFKIALGGLYKKQLITITEKGLYLVPLTNK